MLGPCAMTSATAARSSAGRARLLLLAGMVAVAGVSAGCSSGPEAAPDTTAPPAYAAVAPGDTAEIAISNFAFVPSALTVHPGTKVTVVNRDAVAHNLTSTSGAFATGDIAAGASAVFAAPDRPGVYPYSCTIHPYMAGRLTVS